MFNEIIKNTEWNGEALELSTGKFARQADGSVMTRMRDSAILCTSISAKEAKEGKDASGGKKGKRKDKAAKDEDEGDGTKGASDVAELYHAAASDCHIFCRKVDKKREKSALQESRAAAKVSLKDEACSDAAVILRVGLQLAVMHDGVTGLLFPQEPWAFRLVAQILSADDARDQAVALCDLLEKGDDAVALEAAASAWRQRALGSTTT